MCLAAHEIANKLWIWFSIKCLFFVRLLLVYSWVSDIFLHPNYNCLGLLSINKYWRRPHTYFSSPSWHLSVYLFLNKCPWCNVSSISQCTMDPFALAVVQSVLTRATLQTADSCELWSLYLCMCNILELVTVNRMQLRLSSKTRISTASFIQCNLRFLQWHCAQCIRVMWLNLFSLTSLLFLIPWTILFPLESPLALVLDFWSYSESVCYFF